MAPRVSSSCLSARPISQLRVPLPVSIGGEPYCDLRRDMLPRRCRCFDRPELSARCGAGAACWIAAAFVGATMVADTTNGAVVGAGDGSAIGSLAEAAAFRRYG